MLTNKKFSSKMLLMQKFGWLIIVLILAAFVGFVGFKQLAGQKTTTTPETISPQESSQEQEQTTEPAAPLPVSEVLINEALAKYLPENLLEPSYEGKVFCANHLYGYDEDQTTNLVKAYVWAYCEEYYQENGQLKMGSGVSEPVLVTLELQNGLLGVQGHREPGNGSLYAPSIKEMFPEDYASQAIKGYSVDQFEPSPLEQAEAYYAE